MPDGIDQCFELILQWIIFWLLDKINPIIDFLVIDDCDNEQKNLDDERIS